MNEDPTSAPKILIVNDEPGPKVADAFLSISIEAYREIHDLVNIRHRTQDPCDVLCPK